VTKSSSSLSHLCSHFVPLCAVVQCWLFIFTWILRYSFTNDFSLFLNIRYQMGIFTAFIYSQLSLLRWYRCGWVLRSQNVYTVKYPNSPNNSPAQCLLLYFIIFLLCFLMSRCCCLEFVPTVLLRTSETCRRVMWNFRHGCGRSMICCSRCWSRYRHFTTDACFIFVYRLTELVAKNMETRQSWGY